MLAWYAYDSRRGAFTVEDARLPAEPFTEPVSTSRRMVARILSRAGVGELAAVPAGEYPSTVQDATRLLQPSAGWRDMPVKFGVCTCHVRKC